MPKMSAGACAWSTRRAESCAAAIASIVIAVLCIFVLSRTDVVVPLAAGAAGSAVAPHLAGEETSSLAAGRSCLELASLGEWVPADGCWGHAKCVLPQWRWSPAPAQCESIFEKAPGSLCAMNLTLVGDSMVRNIFHALGHLLGGELPPQNKSLRHSDQEIRLTCGSRIRFLWRPFVSDLVCAARDVQPTEEPLVLSGGLWDALHTRNTSSYSEGIWRLREVLAAGQRSIALWMTTSAVFDEALRTPEKRTFMTDGVANTYRKEALALHPVVAAVLDVYAITAPVRRFSVDGVHYPDAVNAVAAHALARTVAAGWAPLASASSSDTHAGTNIDGFGHLWRGAALFLAASAIFAASKGHLLSKCCLSASKNVSSSGQ